MPIPETTTPKQRLLKFNVTGQRITKAPDCDFTDIVAGTSGYLKAKFEFSHEWDGCTKVAQFWRGDKECATLIENGECDIDPTILVGPTFRVSVIGQRTNFRITTNKTLIRQEVQK